MHRRVSTVLFLFAALMAVPAWSANYYVAQQVSGASDDNDGLSPVRTGVGATGPWKTLTKACAVARAGDNVWVYNGDYRLEEAAGYGIGVIPISNSGESKSKMLTFAAAQGQQPMVNTLLVHDRQWISIRGFTFVSPHFSLPSNWQDMPAIVVDDADVVIDSYQAWDSREAQVRQKYATYMDMQSFFLTEYTNGIDVKNSTNIFIQGNLLRHYSFGIQVRGHSSNIYIEDNHISYCYDGIFSWQPSPSITNSVIRNNILRQNFNNGILIREGASDVVIEHNDVQFSGTSHITLLNGCQNCQVLRNAGQFGGFYSETMEFPGSSAINIHTGGAGNVVDGNLAAYQIDPTGLDGNGFIADLMRDGAGVVFRNNISQRNMGSGLRTVESPNCEIRNNMFMENGYLETAADGSGIHLASGRDINNTIVDNFFFNNLPAGIRSFGTILQQKQIDFNWYFSSFGTPLIWDTDEAGEKVYYTLFEIRRSTPWEKRRFFSRTMMNAR